MGFYYFPSSTTEFSLLTFVVVGGGIGVITDVKSYTVLCNVFSETFIECFLQG